MGQTYSLNKCNYYCTICRLSGKTPNIAGKFFLIDQEKCQCNACQTIYDKKYYYDPHRHHINGTETNLTL